MGLGRFGFAGGLGVLVRGWAGSLGDFDLGPKLTRGFHLNGPGGPHWAVPPGFKTGISVWRGEENPNTQTDGHSWFM